MTDRNLLLVDTRVEEYPQIVAAINASTIAVTFDPSVDSYVSLLEKIATQGVSSFASVAVVQHGSPALPVYRILDSDNAVVLGVETADPDLASWEPIAAFFRALAANYQVQTVDLLGCALYANPGIVYALTRLDERLGVRFRASTDNTGNIALAANWTMESDNVDVKDVYFTEAIEAYSHVFGYSTSLYLPISRNITISATTPVVPMISATNRVVDAMERDPSACYLVPWGNAATTPIANVVAIASNSTAFAALKSDGSVVAWGDSGNGGSAPTSVTEPNSNVIAIVSNQFAFAALKSDESVVAWGNSSNGGNAPASVTEPNSNVVAIAYNSTAFAALKSDGSVVAWGEPTFGGSAPASVTEPNSNVVAIASTSYGFAALKSDGSVVAWGAPTFGESTPASVTEPNSNVVAIVSSQNAFAALKSDGSVVAWGLSSYGGSAPEFLTEPNSNVVAIASSQSAFAALKSDGSLVGWGEPILGGSAPTTVTEPNSTVVAIASSQNAFAALKSDGSVVAWGSFSNGGSAPASVTEPNSNVVAIVSSQNAFAALKSDGSVVAWGNSSYGGSAPASVTEPNSTVVAIASNSSGFAALKSDGSVVAWGNIPPPNSSTAIQLSKGVRRVAGLGNRGFGAFRLSLLTEPSAPTIGTATAGDAQATVSFTAPTNTGGDANITYTVTSSPGGLTASGSGTSLTVTGLTNGTAYTFTVKATNSVGDSAASEPSNSATPMAPAPAPAPAPSGVPCFPAGVMIRTPGGEKAVETLKTGDLVVTAAGRVVPIRMHSYSLEATTKATAPYFIPANALGPKAPAKPLHLSPLHAFQVRPNVWWCAQQAAKVSSKIQQYGLGESITYYHVECPKFLRDNLVADGVVVESFAGKQLSSAESRNLYKFNKEAGGYVRSAPTKTATL